MKPKLLLLLGLLASAVGFAETVTIDGVEWTYTTIKDGSNKDCIQLGDGTTTVSGLSGAVTIPSAITLPGTETTLSVKRLGDNLFSNVTAITSVKIPDSVLAIGKSFVYCSGLESVEMHDGVYQIDGSFKGCSNLVSVTSRGGDLTLEAARLEGLTDSYIGIESFRDCTNLTTVTTSLFRGFTEIKAAAFRGCQKLEGDLKLPNVKRLGDRSLYDCKKITNIIAPHLTDVDTYAIRQCLGLTKLVLESYVKTSNNKTYSGVSGAKRTFSECKNLTQIELPSATKFYNECFHSCLALTTVIAPRVEEIEQVAFGNCTALPSFIIPPGVWKIGTKVFASCTGLTYAKIPYRTTSLGSTAYPFSGCKALKTIDIHESSTLSETSLLNGNSATITRYGGTNEVDGIIWAWDDFGSNGVIILGAKNADGTTVTGDVTIPKKLNGKTVKAIEGFAFKGNTSITSVWIPPAVSSVGVCIFKGCTKLTQISVSSHATDVIEDLSDEFGAEKIKTYTVGLKIIVR